MTELFKHRRLRIFKSVVSISVLLRTALVYRLTLLSFRLFPCWMNTNEVLHFAAVLENQQQSLLQNQDLYPWQLYQTRCRSFTVSVVSARMVDPWTFQPSSSFNAGSLSSISVGSKNRNALSPVGDGCDSCSNTALLKTECNPSAATIKSAGCTEPSSNSMIPFSASAFLTRAPSRKDAPSFPSKVNLNSSLCKSTRCTAIGWAPYLSTVSRKSTAEILSNVVP